MISKNTEKDQAIFGIFNFKSAKIFFKSNEKMKNKKRPVNNEFYVDVALDQCIQLGYEV